MYESLNSQHQSSRGCTHTVLTCLPFAAIQEYQGSTCQICTYTGKNQWLCLHTGCNFVGCGPKGADHSGQHAEEMNHPVAVNLHNLQIFCQKCDSQIRLPISSRQSGDAGPSTLSGGTNETVAFDKTGLKPKDNTPTKYEKPLGTCGLRNLGNTCYMNAALQSLSNCPHLTEYFLQCHGLVTGRSSRLSSQYQALISKLWTPPSSSYLVPLSVLREVQHLYPMFSGYSQHDAQEFLRVFLSQLHDELKTPDSAKDHRDSQGRMRSDKPVVKATNTPGSYQCDCNKKSGGLRTKGKHGRASRSKHKSVLSGRSACALCSNGDKTDILNSDHPQASAASNDDGRSIVTEVFQGKLVSAVRCLSCKELSCREEVFMDLSVSLRRPDFDHSKGSFLRAGGSTVLLPPPRPLAKPPYPVVADSYSTDKSSADRAVSVRTDLLTPTVPNPNNCTERVPLHTRSSTHPLIFGHPILQLTALRHPIPFARRLFTQVVEMVTLSLAWISSKISDFQGWFTRPSLMLEDCLLDYFSQAELYGENKYYCERCKRLCNGLNQSALLSLPEVLCIHMKRFRSHFMDASKITSTVSFPLHGLDLAPYLHADCRDKITIYDLIGVICHRGGYGLGHYVTYSLNWHSQTWYEFDDEHVTEVDPTQVEQLTSEAYILFYRKRDSWLYPFREEAEALVQNHLQICSDQTVYVSRPWLVRFSTWAEPGPVANAELLCEHGKILPQQWCNRESLLFPIPEKLWNKLVAEFGGGPVIRNPSPCSVCRDIILARQEHELTAFEKEFESHEQNWKRCGLYAISATWFNSWKEFVQGRSLDAPGPIDNNDIIDYRPAHYLLNGPLFGPAAQSGYYRQNQPRLKVDVDYQEVYEGCWKLLSSIYGGGPVVCLRQPDSTATSTSTSSRESPEPCYRPELSGVLNAGTSAKTADLCLSSHLSRSVCLGSEEGSSMTSSLPISHFALITSNLADRIPSTQAKSNLDADDDYFSTTYSDGLTDLIKPSLRGSLDDGDRNDSCIGSSLYKTESHISQSLDSLIFSGQGDTSGFVQRSVSGYNKLSGSHGVNSFSLENLSLSSGIEPLTLRELMAGDCQLSNHVYPACNGIDAKISGHSWKRPRLSFDQ